MLKGLLVQGKNKWKGGIDMTVAASKYGSVHTQMFLYLGNPRCK